MSMMILKTNDRYSPKAIVVEGSVEQEGKASFRF